MNRHKQFGISWQGCPNVSTIKWGDNHMIGKPHVSLALHCFI